MSPALSASISVLKVTDVPCPLEAQRFSKSFSSFGLILRPMGFVSSCVPSGLFWRGGLPAVFRAGRVRDE